MRILFLSDNFPPEFNAPASRTYEHAVRWVKAGADVTVITCAPNFPQGEVHEGYANKWRTVEMIDGIRVVRVKTYITSNTGFLRRIIDYKSFMLSAFFFGLFEKRPDVIVGTSPQFFAALGAWMLSVARWRPFVFEVRDIWPASIVSVGAMEPGFIIRILERIELFLYGRARRVVAVSDSIRQDLVDRGINGDKVVVVRNGADLSRFQVQPCSQELAKSLGVDGRFVVGYLGTHGMAHDLGNVLEAAARLRDHANICFLLIGAGAKKAELQEQATSMGLENVRFADPMPRERMAEVWSVCDVALVHLRNTPLFTKVIPSKIFEAMAMSRPILIVQPQGEAVQLVIDSGAGEWVAPGDPGLLAEKVLALSGDTDAQAAFAAAAAAGARSHSRDTRAAEMLDYLRKSAG
jgi:glycosyltransferase involved in cell wall biosynthesis